ncbi:MAG: hypothetical protein NTW19_00280 [Planctomycetota bacterium]|nr:hypothetical protein [Planctomycetota bacterium]
MSFAAFEQNWLTLAFMAILLYALVTCVLATLASQYRHSVSVHDRLRESQELRRRYVEAIKLRNAAKG